MLLPTIPADLCDARAVRVARCLLCPATVEQRGAGRPRHYCDACAPVGKALQALVAALPGAPAAIVGVLEQIEAVDIPRGVLAPTEAKRLRASCFVIGSRGHQLKPGSSGRYTRKTSAAAPVAATEEEAPFALPLFEKR